MLEYYRSILKLMEEAALRGAGVLFGHVAETVQVLSEHRIKLVLSVASALYLLNVFSNEFVYKISRNLSD